MVCVCTVVDVSYSVMYIDVTYLAKCMSWGCGSVAPFSQSLGSSHMLLLKHSPDTLLASSPGPPLDFGVDKQEGGLVKLIVLNFISVGALPHILNKQGLQSARSWFQGELQW